MRSIKITLTDERETIINVDHIVRIYEEEDRSVIVLSNGEKLSTKVRNSIIMHRIHHPS